VTERTTVMSSDLEPLADNEGFSPMGNGNGEGRDDDEGSQEG